MIYIANIEKVLKRLISESVFEDNGNQFPLSFSWGDQKELLQWIRTKDKNIAALRAISENASKYPLIWLAPCKGHRHSKKEFLFSVTLIVSQITDPEWLNETRWNTTMAFLEKVANFVIGAINSDRNLSIKRDDGVEKISFEFAPNYSTDNKGNNTLDIWDAIIIEMDLIMNINCLK